MICGAGFASQEYLALHFERRHPNQQQLHSGSRSHSAHRPADPFTPTMDSYGASNNMRRGAFGGDLYTDPPPMNEPMNEPMLGRAGFPERNQRGPVGGHGGFGERSGFGAGGFDQRSGYGEVRGGYGGGGGDRGGGFGGGFDQRSGYGEPRGGYGGGGGGGDQGEYAAPRPYKRQREEMEIVQERTVAWSRRRTDGKLSGTAQRWNEEKVLMDMCIAMCSSISKVR